VLHARQTGRPARVAAGRNAHKAFLSAAALLDVEVEWLCPRQMTSYLSCPITAQELEQLLQREGEGLCAVYLTDPDYLGNRVDIAALSRVCRRHGVLLLVDNAHGAYLKFFTASQHPVDLGADLCCDSAHKTLPVLTGGAYLHVGHEAPAFFARQAKQALALFGSTSPSYLILQSLDAANQVLEEEYPWRLREMARELDELKERLAAKGWQLQGSEPMKLTLCPKSRGYTGEMVAKVLERVGVVCEYADPDHLVCMFSPEIELEQLGRLERLLEAFAPCQPIDRRPPAFSRPERAMSIRQAILSPSEEVDVKDSVGRVLASPSVGCPPAVPIVVCGERIDQTAAACFAYYGIRTCFVVKE